MCGVEDRGYIITLGYIVCKKEEGGNDVVVGTEIMLGGWKRK